MKRVENEGKLKKKKINSYSNICMLKHLKKELQHIFQNIAVHALWLKLG